MLDRGVRLQLRYLFDVSDTVEVAPEESRGVDPELATLENLNHRDAYERALRRWGSAS